MRTPDFREMAVADLDDEFGTEAPLWRVYANTAIALAICVGGALAAAYFVAWF